MREKAGSIRTLAELYDQDKIPMDLEACRSTRYGVLKRLRCRDFLMGIKKIIVHLFKLYAETIEQRRNPDS